MAQGRGWEWRGGCGCGCGRVCSKAASGASCRGRGGGGVEGGDCRHIHTDGPAHAHACQPALNISSHPVTPSCPPSPPGPPTAAASAGFGATAAAARYAVPVSHTPSLIMRRTSALNRWVGGRDGRGVGGCWALGGSGGVQEGGTEPTLAHTDTPTPPHTPHTHTPPTPLLRCALRQPEQLRQL